MKPRRPYEQLGDPVLGRVLPCPACGHLAHADDLRAQAAHMTERHPDIVAARRAESARWDGWENE